MAATPEGERAMRYGERASGETERSCQVSCPPLGREEPPFFVILSEAKDLARARNRPVPSVPPNLPPPKGEPGLAAVWQRGRCRIEGGCGMPAGQAGAISKYKDNR